MKKQVTKDALTSFDDGSLKHLQCTEALTFAFGTTECGNAQFEPIPKQMNVFVHLNRPIKRSELAKIPLVPGYHWGIYDFKDSDIGYVAKTYIGKRPSSAEVLWEMLTSKMFDPRR